MIVIILLSLISPLQVDWLKVNLLIIVIRQRVGAAGCADQVLSEGRGGEDPAGEHILESPESKGS